MPKTLEHRLGIIPRTFERHVPSVDEREGLLRFARKRSGEHVVRRALIHLPNIHDVEPHAGPFANLGAIGVVQRDDQLAFALCAALEEKILGRVGFAQVGEKARIEDECSSSVHALVLVVLVLQRFAYCRAGIIQALLLGSGHVGQVGRAAVGFNMLEDLD